MKEKDNKNTLIEIKPISKPPQEPVQPSKPATYITDSVENKTEK